MIKGYRVLFSRTFSEDYCWLMGKEHFSADELKVLQKCINTENTVFEVKQFSEKCVFVSSFMTEAKDLFSRPIQALSGICFEGEEAFLAKQLLPWMINYFANMPNLLCFYTANEDMNNQMEISLDDICGHGFYRMEDQFFPSIHQFVIADPLSYRMQDNGCLYVIKDKSVTLPNPVSEKGKSYPGKEEEQEAGMSIFSLFRKMVNPFASCISEKNDEGASRFGQNAGHRTEGDCLPMSEEKIYPPIGRSWDEVRDQLFTPEEIAESDLRVALMGELIRARQEKGISQKKLEKLSGVKQPVIARMETGKTSPQLDTVMKVLHALGKTLAIVPLENK